MACIDPECQSGRKTSTGKGGQDSEHFAIPKEQILFLLILSDQGQLHALGE